MNSLPYSVAGISLSPPSPDFERLRRVLLRQGEPDRVPFIELFADKDIIESVLGEPLPNWKPEQIELRKDALLKTIRYWWAFGYDYVTVSTVTGFRHKRIETEDTADLSRGKRAWVDESRGVINDWKDFQSYPWPDPQSIDYFDVEFVAQHLPEGMQIIFMGPGGVLENAMWLMEFEPFAFALKYDPDLVEANTTKIGHFLTTLRERRGGA